MATELCLLSRFAAGPAVLFPVDSFLERLSEMTFLSSGLGEFERKTALVCVVHDPSALRFAARHVKLVSLSGTETDPYVS